LTTCVLIALGTILYWSTGAVASDTMVKQLDRAVADCQSLKDAGDQLNASGTWLLQDLNSIPPICAHKAPGPIGTIKGEVAGFMAQVSSYHSGIKALPQELRDAKDWSTGIGLAARLGLLIPMALVSICCCSVFLAMLFARSGRCGLCCVASLGPVFFAPTVLLVTGTGAAQLEVAIVSSSFCSRVDSNALTYIEHLAGTNSTLFALSKYYITGNGLNPLLKDLENTAAKMQSLQTTLAQFSGAITRSCPDWHGAGNMSSSIARAQTSIDHGQRLLSLANVYPYYDQVVHKDACQTLVIGLGWLFLSQAVVGLVCLPCLIWVVRRYLKARSAWHGARLVPDAFLSEVQAGV